MPEYGYEMRITTDTEGVYRVVRDVVHGADESNARRLLRRQLRERGEVAASVDLLAEGETFRESGKRRLMSLARALCRRFDGAVITGPWESPADGVTA